MGILAAAPILLVYLALRWAERHRPLRGAVEDPHRRARRNLALAGIGALALRLVEAPVVRRACDLVEARGWGLARQLPLPHWLQDAVAMLLLDYALYVWHVLLHRMPVLWRFHVVHHVDLDLDASTALRFHFAELVLSAPWRAGTVLLAGAGHGPTRLWQAATLVSILFHHANVRLPIGLERRLVRWLVTPRMHGVHHSAVHAHTHSNWSSLVSVWDRLHGTLRLDVPQGEITIGVPAYREPVALRQALRLPFRAAPSAWRDQSSASADDA